MKMAKIGGREIFRKSNVAGIMAAEIGGVIGEIGGRRQSRRSVSAGWRI